VWHLPQFSKRLELLIKPSGFGYNAYNQAIYVKIPNQIIPYLTEDYHIGFVGIDGNIFCFSSRKFSPGTNEVEYYVRVESIDDINYTSLFIYYSGFGVDGVCGPDVSESYVFDDVYIVNYLSETNLVSVIGPNFSNHSAALHQPICDTYAAKTTGGTTYVSCSISKSVFTLFFNCYLVSGSGYLVYFSSNNYVYVNLDGSLVARINGVDYHVGSKLYFGVCSTFSITSDGSNVYVVINGLTKLVIKQTLSISEICLGGNGSGGYSVECYFFDLFLLPSKLPLYSYYLHNTIYDNSNFFRDSGYDNIITNGYLTNWPEVIFSGDEAIFKFNGELVSDGWRYYRPITITNSGISFLSDYSVRLKLTTSGLGNPYNNINSSGSDICFSSISGSLFGYWIESWDNTGDSYVWVSVGGIPLGDSTIRMYYGYLGATSYSNGEDVFCFFDDFSSLSDKWITGGQGAVSVTNGYIYPSSFGGGGHVWHGPDITANFNSSVSNYAWKVRYYLDHCVADNLGKLRLYIRDSSDVTTERLYTHDAHNHVDETSLYFSDADGGFFSCGGTGVVCYDDGWHIWEGVREGTNLTIWFDDVQKYNGVRTTTPVSSKFYIEFSQHSSYPALCTRVDYIYVRNCTPIEPTTVIGSEVALSGFLISIPLNLYGSETLLCSVSFNNGSSWYVSNLNYDDMFTRYFGLPKEYDTVLRLTSSEETIDKNYIVKINDFNQFDVNYLVDFTAGLIKDGHDDTETNFIVALPTLSGIKATPVEYTYEVDAANLKSTYLDRPVEYLWGGTLGSGVISKDVEYCFDIVMDSWVDDTEIDFWLGELHQGYYRNYYTYFTLSSGWFSYTDLDVDFVLANWKYFPIQANIICSTIDYNDQEIEVNIGKGRLMRFLSDIKASNMVYNDFSSSIFCSLSGIFPDCFSEVQVISGSIGNYDSDIYCSLLDISNNFGAEIKLNTVVIENFNIDKNVIIGTSFCFSVDVYDMYYGVTTSGIQVYMNTTTISGNEVTNKTFLTISGGHTVSWCYDVGGLSPSEYIEIVIKGTNGYGDLNIASYFLRYGKRYYYNLYHITKHDYEVLIPMLMVAENNVSIFPSFSTESMYVRIENYKRKSLGASIFGVSLDRGDIQAEVVALTNNFYNGGHYKVRVECNDLSGNVMNPLEFEFTIRSDGL
jgi:hypothetical protein